MLPLLSSHLLIFTFESTRSQFSSVQFVSVRLSFGLCLSARCAWILFVVVVVASAVAWIASINRCSLSQVCTSVSLVSQRQTQAVYCFSWLYRRSHCKSNPYPVVCVSLRLPSFPSTSQPVPSPADQHRSKVVRERKEDSDWCSAEGWDGSSASASPPDAHCHGSIKFPLIEAIAFHSLKSFLFQNNSPLCSLPFLFHRIWGVSSGTFFFFLSLFNYSAIVLLENQFHFYSFRLGHTWIALKKRRTLFDSIRLSIGQMWIN